MQRWILVILAAAALPAQAADKDEDNPVERGLQKAGKAIEHGAKAAGRGAERGGKAVIRTLEKAHDKVDDKVRPEAKKK